MLPLSLIFLASALLLYALARRGFLGGHHPHCAACAYDLHMLQEGTTRCPECGSLITGHVSIGRRRPSRPCMLAAAFIALAGILLLCLAAPPWWRQFDGAPYLPASTLQTRIPSPDPQARTRALAELQRRLSTGSLTPQDFDPIAARILKLQADIATRWDPRWGELLETAHRAANPILPRRQWEQYLAQAMRLKLLVRPRISAHDPIPFQLICDLKAGNLANIALRCSPVITLQSGGPPAIFHPDPLAPISFIPTLQWSLLWLRGTNEQPWPPGSRRIHATVAMTLREPRESFSHEDTFDIPVEILEGSSVTFHAGTPEETEKIAAAVHWYLKEDAGKPNPELKPESGNLGRLWIETPPIACAFRVVLRQGDHEWILARFLVRPDDAATAPLVLPPTAPGAAPQPGKAEIICIPDPQLPTGTVDMLEIWGQELRRNIILAQ